MESMPHGAIGRDALARAAERARTQFLETREETSLTYISAQVFFAHLATEIQTRGGTETVPITRQQFRTELKSRDPNLGARKLKTIESAADDFADEISKLRCPIDIDGVDYVISFTGPTPRGARRARRGDLLFTMMLSAAVPAEAGGYPHPLAGLMRKCFCCGHEDLNYDPGERFCGRSACASREIRQQERDLYVTVFPERPTESPSKLPGFDHPFDFFAVKAFAEDRDRRAQSPLRDLFPYREDHLANMGLRLGRPTVYQIPQLETPSGFTETYVLDLSTYLWSNTLKDPKSWAVVNAALDDRKIEHLVAYTAGNAGLSLAKIAYAANRLMGYRRIRVHALVDESVGEEIRSALKAWHSEIIDIPRDPDRRVISEATVWSLLTSTMGGASQHSAGPVPVAGAWHVSDGWDGVAVSMYRLLFAQVLSHLPVDYVIVPIGTGNLLLGAQLGLRDTDSSARMIGAVPAGENILENCRQLRVPLTGNSGVAERIDPANFAQAPKLVGRYTPLMPCIAQLIQDEEMVAIEVTREFQVAAAKHLTHVQAPNVAAEPSALVAFGALLTAGPGSLKEFVRSREETERSREFASASRVLVVNTGYGVVSADDAAFASMARAGLLRR